MMMMSYEEWAKMLANVNCLVSVFCLRAVNAVVLRVDSYCLTKQSEMDEAMWNRYAPIPNAMNENKKTANFQSFIVIAIARKVLLLASFSLKSQ